MRTRWLAAGLVLAVIAAGCSAGSMARKDESQKKEISEATVVTCPKCGNPFKIGAGLTQTEKLE